MLVAPLSAESHSGSSSDGDVDLRMAPGFWTNALWDQGLHAVWMYIYIIV